MRGGNKQSVFYPEDGGDTFLRNVGSIHKIYTAPHINRNIRIAPVPKFEANNSQPQKKFLIIELALSVDGRIEKNDSDHASAVRS
jgi:hypothetical protein